MARRASSAPNRKPAWAATPYAWPRISLRTAEALRPHRRLTAPPPASLAASSARRTLVDARARLQARTLRPHSLASRALVPSHGHRCHSHSHSHSHACASLPPQVSGSWGDGAPGDRARRLGRLLPVPRLQLATTAPMASGQRATGYSGTASFVSQQASAPYPAPAPPLNVPMTLPASMPVSVGMGATHEPTTQPPPLPAPPRLEQPAHPLPAATLPEHLSPPPSLALHPPPPHSHAQSHYSAPQHATPLHSLQQQPPPPPPRRSQPPSHYPSTSAIPALHSMPQPANMLHSFASLQSFPWSTMAAIDGYPSMPGMHSLIQQHPRFDSLAHHPPPHHTSTTIPALASSLGAALTSSPPFAHSPMLNGAIGKPRKLRRRSDLSAPVKGEDHHALMMNYASSKYDPSAVLLPAQPPVLNLPEADGVQFKLLHQLPEAKVRRLRDEKIKPIEDLTFDDIKAYNRNQLRAYCFVYGIKRRKKAEMEQNMARYASMFHPNDPSYQLEKFEPTKYIPGAIPRRKVPVTKEQKERAAGNAQELTKAIQRRPQVSAYTHDAFPSAAHHHLSFPHGPATAQPPPLPSHGLNHNPRLYDEYSVGASHEAPQSHLTSAVAPPNNPDDVTTPTAADVMTVHEHLHVPSHLLGLASQLPDE